MLNIIAYVIHKFRCRKVKPDPVAARAIRITVTVSLPQPIPLDMLATDMQALHQAISGLAGSPWWLAHVADDPRWDSLQLYRFLSEMRAHIETGVVREQ